MTGGDAEQGDALIPELTRQLLRHPAHRDPVGHAMAQFQLGVALLQADRPADAVTSLRTCADLFGSEGQHVERAKALNMLGAALRMLAQPAAARAAFTEALELFEAAGERGNEAAVRFNLGLVHAGEGEVEEAVAYFRGAHEWFAAHGRRAEAAAAGRELGAGLLAQGLADEACTVLDGAVDLALQAGDRRSAAAAANVLGLAHLGANRVDRAVEAFQSALASSPRAITPETYAMAKANLGLAYERQGAQHRARLAARQALAAPRVPLPVADQAESLLGRLPECRDALARLLDEEEPRRWQALLREELVWWAETDERERRLRAAEWVDALFARAEQAPDRAEAWLAVLLELPSEAMESLIAGTLAALPPADAERRERFRTVLSRAMVRFAPPQWLRLQETFTRLAQAGQEGSAQERREERWG